MCGAPNPAYQSDMDDKQTLPSITKRKASKMTKTKKPPPRQSRLADVAHGADKQPSVRVSARQRARRESQQLDLEQPSLDNDADIAPSKHKHVKSKHNSVQPKPKKRRLTLRTADGGSSSEGDKADKSSREQNGLTRGDSKTDVMAFLHRQGLGQALSHILTAQSTRIFEDRIIAFSLSLSLSLSSLTHSLKLPLKNDRFTIDHYP